MSIPAALVDAVISFSQGDNDAATEALFSANPLSKVSKIAQGVRKGVSNGTKGTSPNVKKVLDGIKENDFKVKVNPRNQATKQEGNVTIDFGDKTKVNLRVETHSFKKNGPNVRHGNVETTRQVKNKNKVTSNKHIFDD